MPIKTYKDYVDKVNEKFPEVSKEDIDEILKHGIMSLYKWSKHGCDVNIVSGKYRAYIGKYYKNRLLMYIYHHYKMKIMLRLKYALNKSQWDGYWYFGFSEREYHDLETNYANTKNRNTFEFLNVYLFKIKEECYDNRKNKYFYKCKYPECFLSKKRDELKRITGFLPKVYFKSGEIELIAIRDSTNNIMEFNVWQDKNQ